MKENKQKQRHLDKHYNQDIVEVLDKIKRTKFHASLLKKKICSVNLSTESNGVIVQTDFQLFNFNVFCLKFFSFLKLEVVIIILRGFSNF